MTYETMIQNSDQIDRLMIKWQPVLSYTSEAVPPIVDMIVKMQTAIMLERVESKYSTATDLKREIPKTRREFPLLSETGRINMINELAVQYMMEVQGITLEQAKLYLGV